MVKVSTLMLSAMFLIVLVSLVWLTKPSSSTKTEDPPGRQINGTDDVRVDQEKHDGRTSSPSHAAAANCDHGPDCAHEHGEPHETSSIARKTFEVPHEDWRTLQAGSTLRIPLNDDLELEAVIQRRWDDHGAANLTARLVAPHEGSVGLRWRDNQLFGLIKIPSRNQAYRLEAAEAGVLAIEPLRLSDLLCVMPAEGQRAEPGQPVTYGLPRPTNEVVAARAAGEFRTTAVPERESRPGSTRVVYLDFDGETVNDPFWNNGNTIIAPAARLNDSQINEVWRRVIADFDGFDVNVSTVRASFDTAPSSSRTHVIITDNDAAAPGAGGVAYLDSFDGSPSRYCWVFIDTDAKDCAEVVSHEVGHTLNLNHDGRTNPVEDYYEGHGLGFTGWAPIMGVGYYRTLVQWSKGEYPNANRTDEDDLLIIAGKLPYLADDHGNTTGTATAVVGDTATGRIERNTDLDVFRLELTDGVHVINLQPAEHSNLDGLLEISDASGALLATANPVDAINASATFTLDEAQTVYARVRGTGKSANESDFGYTSYASLGAYTLSGFGDQEQPPSPPLGLSLRVISGAQVALSWQNALGATTYNIYRNGLFLLATNATVHLDLNLTPGATYRYEVSAGNAFGFGALSNPSEITTPAADAFVMDGNADFAAYLISNPGMVIHAAVRGNRLYVATWSPGDNSSGFGSDHHLLISDELLPSATTPMPWAKAGFMAIPGNKPFLAGESTSTYAGWFNTSGSADLFKSPLNGLQLEGSIDLVSEFGAIPETIYLAAIAFGTEDGGGINGQAPAGNGNNNLEPGEFLAVPVASIRDSALNGTYDILAPDRDFIFSPGASTGPGAIGFTWYAVPGRIYVIHRGESLKSPVSTWPALETNRAADGQFVMEFDDTSPPEGNLYYRLRLLP